MSDHLLTVSSASTRLPAASKTVLAAVRAVSRDGVRALLLAYRVATTRRVLRDLDARLLADIGVTPVQARNEADRPPWHLRPGRPGGHKVRTTGPLLAAVATAWGRWHSRRVLATLDARLLKDIGASATEAATEANKPFWRA